jgi:hypothetical protein
MASIRAIPLRPAAVAIARVLEARVRRSERATRIGRAVMASMTKLPIPIQKVSLEVRALIRLRLMKLV